MADVCVITGGGSGMGLAAAKYMPKEKILVLAGRTEAKLQRDTRPTPRPATLRNGRACACWQSTRRPWAR